MGSVAGEVDEARGGIDNERSADDNENIGGSDEGDSLLDHGYGLFEPDDVGAQLSAVFGLLAQKDIFPDVIDEGFVLLAAHLEYLAVQVEHAGTAGAFVEVVNILGDDVDVEVLFQLGKAAVGSVGFGFGDVAAPHIIEVEDKRRILAPG